MNIPILYDLPIWISGALFVAVMLVALEIGYRLGVRRREVSKDEDFAVSNVVVTSILATFGLLLAFTYAFTVSRADMRKRVSIDEANAKGTAFLRTGLVPNPESAELKRALLEYARTRIITSENISSRARFNETLRRSLEAQAKLWPITERIVKSRPPGPVEALLVAAINQVLDMHTTRLAIAFDRLPQVILLMLLFVSSASITIAGFSSGLSARFNRWRMTALAFVFAFVIFIIMDFDYPQQGFIRINQQPLLSTIDEMETNLSSRE
jgi:hypothetical protein